MAKKIDCRLKRNKGLVQCRKNKIEYIVEYRERGTKKSVCFNTKPRAEKFKRVLQVAHKPFFRRVKIRKGVCK